MWKRTSFIVVVLVVAAGLLAVWSGGRRPTSSAKLPNFWGRVLEERIDGLQPLDGVKLQLGEHVAVSDTRGFFAFYGVDEGPHTLDLEVRSRSRHRLNVEVKRSRPRWPDIVVTPDATASSRVYTLSSAPQPLSR